MRYDGCALRAPLEPNEVRLVNSEGSRRRATDEDNDVAGDDDLLRSLPSFRDRERVAFAAFTEIAVEDVYALGLKEVATRDSEQLIQTTTGVAFEEAAPTRRSLTNERKHVAEPK